MTGDAAQMAATGSWVATGLGMGLWVYGWLGEKNPIAKMRFHDAGMVLVFSSIIVRVLIQDRAMTWFDWILVVVAPLFIAAALWRLKRTGGMTNSEDR
ncbi:hypothetical protein [Brevundimonas sp.]|uniref:hypothetical protein n=1 Tax=Brevundimonas sp. TaxID=1871086 RepID=UPI0025B8F864|nr:hypothetical protein [Brevundimonas sp.]